MALLGQHRGCGAPYVAGRPEPTFPEPQSLGVRSSCQKQHKHPGTLVEHQPIDLLPSEPPPGCSPACLSPRGLILQDLTFVHLGNPDYIDGKVNFSKRWQQFNILDSMRCFQQA